MFHHKQLRNSGKSSSEVLQKFNRQILKSIDNSYKKTESIKKFLENISYNIKNKQYGFLKSKNMFIQTVKKILDTKKGMILESKQRNPRK